MTSIGITELNALILVFSSLVFGFLIHLSLVFCGEKWSDNFHYKITFTLLPFISMVISKVIAGNIALSLGMVGALSIIRFRNPVKNPFELVMYFALLTLGITLGVNKIWGIIFAIIIILIILTFRLFKNSTNISFQEGNELYTLEIKSKHKIDNILKNEHLKNYSEIKNNEGIKYYNYFFCYNDKNIMLEENEKFKNLIKDNDVQVQINL